MKLFREALQENGQGSLSRVACAYLIFMASLWCSFMIWKEHKLPDLAGVITLITLLYGINKAPAMIGAATGNTVTPSDGAK